MSRVFHTTTPNTGHKGFDHFCDYITTGNHSGNGVFPQFVRSFDQVECNDQRFAPGHLQGFDLRPFSAMLSADELQHVRRLTRDRGGCLYVFRYRRRKRDLYRIFGCVLTDADGGSSGPLKPCKVLYKSYGPHHKARQVIDWCARLVSEGIEELSKSTAHAKTQP